MNKKELSQNLETIYKELAPFSDKYKIDFRRYRFTLEILYSLNIENKKILDIGTGIGILPLTLNKLGRSQATGLDYFIFPENNNKMFQQGSIKNLQKIWQENNTKILNQNIYAETEKLQKEQFDIITSEATIEHLQDPKKYIERCVLLLKPRGYLLISTPNSAKLINRLRFLVGLSPNWPVSEFYTSGTDFTGHWREYTINELKTICEISNLEIINTYNKNLLAHFGSLSNWRRNYRALIALLANLLPNAKDMNYILCRKKAS